jgi:hypothetical protein
MSAHVVLSCDGHREGERCVGQRHCGTRHAPTAFAEAQRAGWSWRPGVGHLCGGPAGHDEDQTRRASR